MVAMIEVLMEKGAAYQGASGDVYFRVRACEHYGDLSHQSVDQLRVGARVDLVEAKEDPLDFVLWKQSLPGEPAWPSPWGEGRPGWHIECSAMTAAYLGSEFDIHAGGLDLIFPHHENEIAQSCCAHDTEHMAHYWVHNGYVTVDGEKMSKSLGNFTTVRDALENHRGEAVRYALLNAHYRAPLDYSDTAVKEAKQALDRLYRAAGDAVPDGDIPQEFLNALYDDLLPVSGVDGIKWAKRLASEEGIFTGVSGGSSLAVAIEVAAHAPAGSNILCMLPDTGERYLSTPLFDDIEVEMSADEIALSQSTPGYQLG